jgi:hypothetical protein
MPEVYEASRTKSARRTNAEMEDCAAFLIDYAERHGPVTVRQLYYRAEVEGLPGIDKTDNGYDKIQRQVLMLRRAGRLPYDDVADLTRWMRKPRRGGSAGNRAVVPKGAVARRRGYCRGLVREGCTGRRHLSDH